MFKKTKKILSCALAACSIVVCAGTLTACETNNPEVQMKIEFNGETYTLDYKLYRKITPNTVNHFLWLADGGYYNQTVIHNYDASGLKMYGGLYSYNAEEEDYYEDISYKAFCEKYASSFPVSVYKDSEGTMPTYTVYGEFANNQFTVKNGSVKESFGTLAMYYTTKDTDNTVYVKRADGKGLSSREYSQNSATTAFYMSLGTTTKTNKSYCTFATLKEDSVSVLEDLQQAITDYIEEKYDSNTDDFVTKTAMTIDVEDAYVGDQDKTTTYDVPNEPIIIKSVKVTKY